MTERMKKAMKKVSKEVMKLILGMFLNLTALTILKVIIKIVYITVFIGIFTKVSFNLVTGTSLRLYRLTLIGSMYTTVYIFLRLSVTSQGIDVLNSFCFHPFPHECSQI